MTIDQINALGLEFAVHLQTAITHIQAADSGFATLLADDLAKTTQVVDLTAQVAALQAQINAAIAALGGCS